MLSNGAVDLIERLEAATSASDVGRRLVSALAPLGACGVFAGSFPAQVSAGLRERVAQARVLAQHSPAGWRENYVRRELDHGNPVILAPGRTVEPFRWSQGGVPALKGWKGLELARELRIEDGFAIPCADLGCRAGIVSLAFERFRVSPMETRMIQLAAIVGYERMQALSPKRPSVSEPDPLTVRERDCLGHVAMGKSDSQIGDVLGLSTFTVHWHLKNAKRKLGVRTRAQAVARLYARGLL